MVGVEVSESVELPKPGDQVLVAWGLDTVRGHVVEAYVGARPKVVVEIDAGQVDSGTATVTVPPGALQPAESSGSSWARGARYERLVGDALLRLLSEEILHVGHNSEIAGREADLLVTLKDGTSIVVEVKANEKPLTKRATEQAIRQLNSFAVSRPNLLGLLVSSSDLPVLGTHVRKPGVGFVKWAGIEDDDALAQTLDILHQERHTSA